MTTEQRLAEISAKLDQIILCLATLARQKTKKKPKKEKTK